MTFTHIGHDLPHFMGCATILTAGLVFGEHHTDLPWTVNLIKRFIEHWSKRILSKNPVASIYLDLYKKFENEEDEYDDEDEYDEDEYDEDDGYSHSITVQFALTDEDEQSQDAPRLSDFSEQELSDLRTCIELELVFDTDNPVLQDYPNLKIVGLEVIYDGITPCDGNQDMDMGYWFENDQLCGVAAPIIRFQLNQEVDAHSFLAALAHSSVWFKSAHMQNNPVEGCTDAYIAIDRNGSSSSTILPSDCNFWDYWSPDEEAFCGKVFHFPDGMEGCVLVGTDFILKRESWIKD